MGDVEKKSVEKYFEKAKVFAEKHKKVIGAVLVVVVILIALAASGMFGENFTPWSSPDYALKNKNHTGQTRRSDSKNDNWSKKDFLQSVSRFNRIAAMSR